MGSRKSVWYELDMAKDMMSLMGGKALRGIMNNFISGRIYSGTASLFMVKNLLKATINKEQRRALIITDEFTKKFSQKVTKHLKLIDFEYQIWSGVKPEVPLPTIKEGVKVCKRFKPTVIIAIGGGSVLDTSKIVLIKYEKPKMNLHMLFPFVSEIGLRKKTKYLIAIPTTSGTGSEVTQAAVATDISREPPKKLEVVNSEIVPDMVVLDTYFVKDLPPFLTMATGIDALSHAIGSYVSNWDNPIIDALNIKTIKLILKFLPRAYKYGANDLEARRKMQWAATMSGLAFSNTVAGIDHALGHSFGKLFGVHHGLAVGLFTPYAVEYQGKITDTWKDLCPLFGIDPQGKRREQLLTDLTNNMKEFIRSINGATAINEIERAQIKKDEYMAKLDLLAEYADNDVASLSSYRSIDVKGYRKIFEYAWDGKNIDF
ncbi:MAG: iron-containing alcohol dehydrogenase [Promethearchaeia archaeon]